MAHQIDAQTFGRQLAYYREKEGYTVKQLADKCVLLPHVIQNIESGRKAPSIQEAHLIARTLGVELTELDF